MFRVSLTNDDGEVFDTFDSHGLDLTDCLVLKDFVEEIHDAMARYIIYAKQYKAVNTGIREVCDLYDMSVISDIIEGDDSSEDHPKPITVYCIGYRGDRSVGMDEFQLTPWFNSMEGLNAFCLKHIDKFREVSDLSNPPDTHKWEI